MGRRMKRRPLVKPVPRWKACRDAYGQWVVVNEAGELVLESHDPLVRFESVWLASKAPGAAWWKPAPGGGALSGPGCSRSEGPW